MCLPVHIYDSVKSRGGIAGCGVAHFHLNSALVPTASLLRRFCLRLVSPVPYPASGQTSRLTRRCGPACRLRWLPVRSASFSCSLLIFLSSTCCSYCPFFLWICLSSELSHGVVLYIWYLLSVVPLFSFNYFSLHCLFLYYL